VPPATAGAVAEETVSLSPARIAGLLSLSLFACLGESVAGQSAPSRTDLFGDALPDGALARLGTVRWRTGSSFGPFGSALGNDGRSLFVSGGEALRIFNVDTGELMRTIRGHEGGINCLALSPDGKMLASAGSTRAFLWDVASGKQLRPLKVSGVSTLAFSPDGTKLITGGQDHEHSVRIFDCQTGKEQLRLLWHSRQVDYIACTPDGNKLVTASSSEGKVLVTDMTTGEVVRTFQSPNVYETTVALSPDGKMLAVADTRYAGGHPRTVLRLFDLTTGRESRALPGVQQRTVALIFSPDGKTLVSSGEKDVHVWDVATGAEKRHFPGGGSHLHFSPDGKRLISTAAVIRVWDVDSGKEFHPPEGFQGYVSSLCFAPDGKTVAACSWDWDRGVIVLWDARTGQLLRTLRGHESYIRSLQFAQDGRLISGGGDSTLRVWDAGAGKELFQFKMHEPRAGEKPLQVLSMGVSRDGLTLATAAVGFEGAREEIISLFFWNLANRKLLAHRERKGSSFPFPGFSPDGKSALLHDGKDLVLSDLLTGKELLKLQPVPTEGGPGVLNAEILEEPIAFSPDGRFVAVGSSRQRRDGNRFWRDNYAFRLFDARTGKELHRIPLAEWRRAVAFSPDGNRAAALDGRTLRIWDPTNGKELWHSPNLDSDVMALAFSPDGGRLASGLDNCTILIWDVHSTK
jgi:WD40 repeat protein